MTDNLRFKALKDHNTEINKVVRESIQGALLILLKNKSYNSITITEICKKGGVSRVAFYSNYHTLTDVLEEIINEQTIEIFSDVGHISMEKVSLEWYINFFHVIKEKKDFFDIVYSTDFLQRYIRIVDNYLIKKSSSGEEEMRKIIWFGGLVTASLKWKDENMTTPEEEIASYCYKYLY